MQFNKNHGGREKYHPTQLKKDAVNDCVIRAIAIALELDYMEVKRDLFAIALENGAMPNSKRTYEAYLSSFGWVKKSPLKNGNKKYRVKNIGKFFKGQNVIVHTRNHVTTLIDGVLNDSWNCKNWCANSYYIKGGK